MRDGLEFFCTELHLIVNHDVMRRLGRALEGTVSLEEKINYGESAFPCFENQVDS